ncbi:hypothetical protein LWI28_025417 [Acer negundo]|uniref:Uncharacterized protein n=1 Tax=Acer negundo TaxID=4023 RepID=A0AAD5NP80_ACENE|nr:hypothetical protein LWI28_025417 [Acer negundo]
MASTMEMEVGRPIMGGLQQRGHLPPTENLSTNALDLDLITRADIDRETSKERALGLIPGPGTSLRGAPLTPSHTTQRTKRSDVPRSEDIHSLLVDIYQEAVFRDAYATIDIPSERGANSKSVEEVNRETKPQPRSVLLTQLSGL